mgnify:CR=1 FL=1
MNYSDDFKFVWWSTGGAATRSVCGILGQSFGLNPRDSDRASSHDVGIPEHCSDYKIICNVRNPYSWFVSAFTDEDMHKLKSEGERLNFSECIKTPEWFRKIALNVHISERWEELGIKNPDYYIKMEDIRGSIENIPILQPTPDIDWSLHEENQYKHKDDDSGTYRSYDEKGVRNDWKKYYTQELADIIYNHPEIKKMFDLTGYDRDSWK